MSPRVFNRLADETIERGLTMGEDETLVLVVDPDREYCKAVKKHLEKNGMIVSIGNTVDEALMVLDEGHVNVVISEVRIPGGDAVELMADIKRKELNTVVIFITGYGEVESYMNLMNMGAFEYVNKPQSPSMIFKIVNRALQPQPVC